MNKHNNQPGGTEMTDTPYKVALSTFRYSAKATKAFGPIDYARNSRTRLEELRKLEEQAGISERMDYLRKEEFSYRGDAVTYTERWEADNAVHLRGFLEGHRVATRYAYFGVQDIGLRQKLISSERIRANFEQHAVMDKLNKLEMNVARAEADGGLWWVLASLTAAALVAPGSSLAGLPGALVGALAAYFVGRRIEDGARSRRGRRIEAALYELEATREFNRKEYEFPHVFTQTEECSGEPDEDSKHPPSRKNREICEMEHLQDRDRTCRDAMKQADYDRLWALEDKYLGPAKEAAQ